MTDAERKDRRERRALQKLALISPLVNDLHPGETAMAYARRVCESITHWPDGALFDVQPKTLLKWASEYKRIFNSESPDSAGAAMQYLVGYERKDKGVSRALDSSEARARIAELLTEMPYLSAAAVWRQLQHEGLIDSEVNVRAVQRYFVAQELKFGRDQTAEDRKKFEAGAFGEIWQADTTETLRITENGKTQKTYCIQIIDDHTRMIVGGGMFYEDNALNFQKVLKKAVYKFGSPVVLYSDHGGPYENKQLGLICGSVGTVLRHPRVRDGAAKGKIERSHRSMDSYFFSLLKLKDITSLEQLDSLYQEAVEQYNNMKHSSLGCTPNERYQIAPSVAHHIDAEVIDFDFMNREERVVRNDNTLKIFNTWFDVPPGLAGLKVEVRYVPGTTEGMLVYHNKKKYPIKETDQLKNCHTKREARLPIPRPGKKRGAEDEIEGKGEGEGEGEAKGKIERESSTPERKTSPAPSIFAASEQDVAKGKSRGKRRGG